MKKMKKDKNRADYIATEKESQPSCLGAVRRSALDWWKSLTYFQKAKQAMLVLDCDDGIISSLSEADIELIYVNRV